MSKIIYPNRELYTICKQIQDIIDTTVDHNSNYIEIERMILNALSMYMNYWQPHINIEEKRMNDNIDKTEFVKQTRLVYNTMYMHYGNAKMIDEIQTMVKEDPDALDDVNEYLNFVECLHSIENYQESDIDNPESIFTEKMKIIKTYLLKKAKEAEEMKETMRELTSTLGNVVDTLKTVVNMNDNNNTN